MRQRSLAALVFCLPAEDFNKAYLSCGENLVRELDRKLGDMLLFHYGRGGLRVYETISSAQQRVAA